MAITRPDEYKHTNDTLAFTDGTEVRGGLKQLNDFTIVTLATIPVDKLKEGNLLYITAGANEGNLYTLIDISDHTQTSNWELLGGLSNLIEDLTPQLGADLDLNGNSITGTGDIVVTGDIDVTGDMTVDDIVSRTSAGTGLKAMGGAICISFGGGGAANSTLGGNMSAASTYKIVNLIDPTSAQDSSTKAYTDNGDEKVHQGFVEVTDANTTIDFNSEDFTKNLRLNGITANRTWTVSNAVNGSQLFITVNVASGEQDWELLFSGMSTMVVHPDWINGTSDGVIFPGDASAATYYQVIAVYNGTEWFVNAIDFN